MYNLVHAKPLSVQNFTLDAVTKYVVKVEIYSFTDKKSGYKKKQTQIPYKRKHKNVWKKKECDCWNEADSYAWIQKVFV